MSLVHSSSESSLNASQPYTMPSLFRSMDMTFVRLIMTDDNAYDTMKQLGSFGMLHLNDLSVSRGANHTEAFSNLKRRIQSCNYWLKKLQGFEEAFRQFHVPPPNLDTKPEDPREGDILDAVKAYVEPLEESISKNIVFRKQQQLMIAEAEEALHVLKFSAENTTLQQDRQQAEHVLQQANVDVRPNAYQREDLEAPGGRFANTITGVISSDKAAAFERLLFRVTRGNVISKFYNIEEAINDPTTNESTFKTIFQLVFMGDQLRRRIQRICQTLGATEYPIPPTSLEVRAAIAETEARLGDYRQILTRTDSEITSQLQSIAVDRSTGASPWINWMTALTNERAICDALKKCDQEDGSKMITAEGWIPSNLVDSLSNQLSIAVSNSSGRKAALQVVSNPESTPPTHFELNKFTEAFQAIVNTYGIPRYKEVNPGLFTCISFPFLFGVMYGDIGHASVLFIMSSLLLIFEKRLTELERKKELGEIGSMVFGGRYMIFLMSIFGFYAGTIYNDCFSIPLNLFGSKWHTDPVTNITDYSGPYPYGVDPGWYHTTNELLFMNSFKMKMAVTFGVVHMTFGIILGAMNNLYFKDYMHFFFEFIPRLLFMLCTFGYMVFIIIFKLCSEWPDGSNPPLLIQTMINMFLSPGSVDKDKQLYEGQAIIQAILLLVAVFSVPVMLFVIPCVTNHRMKKHKAAHLHVAVEETNVNVDRQTDESPLSRFSSDNGRSVNSMPDLQAGLLAHDFEEHKSFSNDALQREQQNPNVPVQVAPVQVEHQPAAAGGGHGHGDGPYSFSDHLIIQSIHTIEFVLGAVSNTASYLRLWALSLAHAELSAVFWDKMIQQYGLEAQPIMIVAGFGIWGAATFAVLLCMDVLECFLHALRLHWVEFQNKFFQADGYAFTPFVFLSLREETV